MKPRVLLTNDDGIHSPLMLELARELSTVFNPVVVAPEREMSWASARHVSTRDVTVECETMEPFPRYRITGSPVDCVYIALQHLNLKPALVVSGANFGINAGAARIAFSGTVQAALAAARLGCPAMAVSIFYPRDLREKYSHVTRLRREHYARELAVAADITATLWKSGSLDKGTCTNLNLPFPVHENDRGRITRIHRDDDLEIFGTKDNRIFHPIPAYPDFSSIPPDTDMGVVGRGGISISPLKAQFDDPSADIRLAAALK